MTKDRRLLSTCGSLLFAILAGLVIATPSGSAPISAKVDRYDTVRPRVSRLLRLPRSRVLKRATPRALLDVPPEEADALNSLTELARLVVTTSESTFRLVLGEIQPDLDDVEVIEELEDGTLQSATVQRTGTTFYVGRVSRVNGSRAFLYRLPSGGG